MKNKKIWSIDKWFDQIMGKTKAEVDKCVLVCANCHREIHAGLVQLPVEMQVEK